MQESMEHVYRNSSPDPEAGRPQNLMQTVAPPMTWWWLVLAGAAALVLGLGLLDTVQLFARPLGLLVLGIAIAKALAPIVDWLDRWLPRKLAVASVYLVLFLLLLLIGWWVLPNVLVESQSLRTALPQRIVEIQQLLNERLPFELNQIIEPLAIQLGSASDRLLQLPLLIITRTADIVVNVVALLFISIYALMIGPAAQRFLLSLFPARQHPQIGHVLRKITDAMGGYVRGVGLSAVIIGGITYFGLLLLGVNYAAALAVTAGLLEIIPIFGPIIATGIVVLVALLQSTQLALYSFIFMLLLQQLESNIVTPNVMRHETQVNQLIVMVAVIAGYRVSGFFGILVAIPLVAVLAVIVREVIAPLVRRWTGAERTTRAAAPREQYTDHPPVD